MGSESIRGVTKDAFSFRRFGYNASEDGCPKLEYVVHEHYRPIVRGVMGVGFVGSVDELGGTGAPFFGV